jgi:hypothetical protein
VLSFIDKKIHGLEQGFRRAEASSALVAKVGKEQGGLEHYR